MNVSAARDSFDMVRRSTGKWVPYGERIRRNALTSPDNRSSTSSGKDPSHWAEAAKETRDDLAHHRERFPTRRQRRRPPPLRTTLLALHDVHAASRGSARGRI